MKMEELLSAASDEMDHKHTKEDEPENDSHETSSSSSQAINNASEPAGTSSSKAKSTTPLPPSSSSSSSSSSARNSMRTRSKKESPPPLTIDTDHDHDNDTQTVPSTSPSSSTPSSISPSTSSPATSPSGGAGGEPKKLCKTVGCIVCSKGPPSSFTKGTPIWAQILHLVLFALTESAKVNVMGSPKMKVKRYFHLRDDIYEYISIHWDVICRRERIKNWRHTIGMTLSHYQNLFQNGYHIYQNTGYWSMKDNVPSPYVIDPLIGEGASPGKKRKYNTNKPSSSSQDKDNKEKDKDKDSSAALTPFISDFPISPPLNSSGNHKNNEEEKNKMRRLDLDQTHSNNSNYSGMTRDSSELRKALHNSLLHPPQPRIPMHVISEKGQQGARFDEMKGAIDKFKREMVDIQAEIHSLQEQLQVKKAEEHLLKFLQEGITSFRDKIKTRIELLKTEMAHNQNEHQFQMHNMASELVEKNYAHSHNNYNTHNHNNHNHTNHNNNHNHHNNSNNNHGHSLVYVPPSLKYLHQYARHNNWPDWSCN